MDKAAVGKILQASPYYLETSTPGDGLNLCEKLAERFYRDVAGRVLAGNIPASYATRPLSIKVFDYFTPDKKGHLAIIPATSPEAPVPNKPDDPQAFEYLLPTYLISEGLEKGALVESGWIDRSATPAGYFTDMGEIELATQLLTLGGESLSPLLFPHVKKDDVAAVEALIASGKVNVNARGDAQRTPIFHAVSIKMFDTLLAAGASLGIRDTFGDPVNYFYGKNDFGQQRSETVDPALNAHAVEQAKRFGITLPEFTPVGSFGSLLQALTPR